MTHQEFILNLANEFEVAFMATGLKPVRRRFGNGKDSGCMITALDVAEYQSELFYLSSPKRVETFLANKYKQFDKKWWGTFVSYCMNVFDGVATYPRQWMKRNITSIISENDSPKLMGAAVGGLVYRHVFSNAPKEIVTQKKFEKVLVCQ